MKLLIFGMLFLGSGRLAAQRPEALLALRRLEAARTLGAPVREMRPLLGEAIVRVDGISAVGDQLDLLRITRRYRDWLLLQDCAESGMVPGDLASMRGTYGADTTFGSAIAEIGRRRLELDAAGSNAVASTLRQMIELQCVRAGSVVLTRILSEQIPKS